MDRRGTAGILAALWLLAAPIAAGATAADEGSMAAAVAALEGMGGRSTHEEQWKAATWIAGRFAELGLEVTLPTYQHQGKSWPNVVAAIEGKERRQELVLCIAHLDSKAIDAPTRAPGADDDASGIAILLELARQLRGPLSRTVKFVVFSNEEEGALGSRAFARAARASGTSIAAVVNFDVLGYAGPSPAADWEGLRRIGSPRAGARALWTLAVNLARSIAVPRRAIRVAGRPANAALARAVAGRLRDGGRLDVQEVVKEDCG